MSDQIYLAALVGGATWARYDGHDYDAHELRALASELRERMQK